MTTNNGPSQDDPFVFEMWHRLQSLILSNLLIMRKLLHQVFHQLHGDDGGAYDTGPGVHTQYR